MEFHGNARTGRNSRLLLVERGIDHGWPVAAAAEAAGIAGCLGFGRKVGKDCVIVPRARCLRRGDLPASKVPGDRRVAQAADDCRRERRGIGARIVDGLAMAEADRAVEALTAGAERRSAGELVHVDIKQLGIRQLRISPYRPRSNGKAERLIQTLLAERAYERIYRSSHERTSTLTLLPRPIQLRPPAGRITTDQPR